MLPFAKCVIILDDEFRTVQYVCYFCPYTECANIGYSSSPLCCSTFRHTLVYISTIWYNIDTVNGKCFIVLLNTRFQIRFKFSLPISASATVTRTSIKVKLLMFR